MSGSQPLRGDARERDPREPHHGISGRLTEAVNLPVLALAEDDLEPGLVAFVPEPPNFRGLRRAAIDDDALSPLEQPAVIDLACHLRHVDLR